jgi:hypothetical protein
VPGLFDFIANDAVEQMQPLVDQAGSYATQALGSANAALSYSSLASGSSTGAAQSATAAQTSATTAQGAATGAQGSANAASASAASALNSANHADGSEAVAQAYADVGMAWAEHMPDTIPPNILAVQGVTGDHWSSRWWANRAVETLSEMEDLLKTIPPLAIVYYYTYIAVAGQTVFTGADRDGKVLAYTPGPQQNLMTYENGLLRTPGTDFSASANTVTYTTPCAAGDIVQVWVEGASVAAGVYLPLVGGTMLGAITLAADPAGPLQPVTRQYADGKYLTFAGGTLTGPLVLAGDPVAPLHAVPKQWLDANFLTTAQGDARWVNVSGDTLTGPLVLAADPTMAMGAATRQYVDAKAALYLPLTGGTVTGNLTVTGALTAGGSGFSIGATSTSTASHGLVQAYNDWAPPGNLGQFNCYVALDLPTVSLSGGGTVAQKWATSNQILQIYAVTTPSMANSHMIGGSVTVTMPNTLGDGGGGVFAGGLPTNPRYQEVGGWGSTVTALSPGHYVENFSSCINDNNGGAGVALKMTGYLSTINKAAASNTYPSYGYQATSSGAQQATNAPTSAFRVDGGWLVSLDLSGNTYALNTAIQFRPDITITNDAANLYFNVAGVTSLVVGGSGVEIAGYMVVEGPVGLNKLAASFSCANDAAAAAAGVLVGQLYRNGSVVQVRVT